jgi:hypothetical protein
MVACRGNNESFALQEMSGLFSPHATYKFIRFNRVSATAQWFFVFYCLEFPNWTCD